MTNPSDVAEPPNARALIEAESAFVTAFGQTMVQWSIVEQRLFWFFERLTEMPQPMARAVYYSARNLTARADMLAAAIGIAAAKHDHDLICFIKAILKRARQYNSFRNSIAHGEASSTQAQT